MGNAALFRTAQPIFCLKDIDNAVIKRVILTGLKEKYTGEISKLGILKEKIVSVLIEHTDPTNQIACEIAIKKLGLICNIVYQPMVFCKTDVAVYDTARILGAQSDLVLLSSPTKRCLKSLAAITTASTINILNCSQCPALSFAAMMSIFEHYRTFENLTVSLIGRPYPYFNSLLLLLPRLNVNTRILTSVSSNVRTSPRYLAIAQEFATRAGKGIVDCESLEEALRGTDVIIVSQNIWRNFELYEKDIIKLCNKRWSFLHDSFEGNLYKCDILNHANTLSLKMIENLRWSYFTILLEIFRLKYPEIAEEVHKICNRDICDMGPPNNGTRE